MTADIPGDVRELLATRINTFEKLDLVIGLYAAPRATMSVEELARVTKLPRDDIRRAALELRASLLVELTARGEIVLLPPTSEERAAVVSLAQIHQDDRAAILMALGEIATERIRGLASRTFVAAILRKKSGDDDGR